MSKRGARRSDGIVFDSEVGRICPDCGQPVASCTCAQERKRRSGAPATGVVRVSRETKGRKGSGVTMVSGLPLDADELQTLATELKRRCGSGGTVKAGVIEIQGEHRDRLVQELAARGFDARRAGG